MFNNQTNENSGTPALPRPAPTRCAFPHLGLTEARGDELLSWATEPRGEGPHLRGPKVGLERWPEPKVGPEKPSSHPPIQTTS